MKKIILLFSTLILLYSISFAVEITDSVSTLPDKYVPVEIVTYYGTSDNYLTLSWEAGDGAESYEIRARNVERDVYVFLGKTENLSLKFLIPKTGHYIIELRSVKNCSGELLYSDWIVSTDPTHFIVNGENKGWWIYGYPAPVGELIIH